MMNKIMYMSLVMALFICMANPGQAGAADNICFKCHKANAFRAQVVHQPVARGKCSSCHNPHVAKHENLLSLETSELCYRCHEGKQRSFAKGIVHKPVKEGKCLACHNPHISKRKGLLNGDSPGDNCFTCHKDISEKYEYTHKPYARGECSSCHRPHQSELIQLLTDEPDKLCLGCHQYDAVKVKHSGYPGKLRVCLSCHNPHGSNRKAMIRDVLHTPYEEGCDNCHEKGAVKTEKCLECHDEIEEKLYSSHSHLSDKAVNSCTKCHSPHAADTSKMLNNRQIQICRQCHANTFAGYEDSLHRHQEISLCSNCHDLHGSNQMAMLKGGGNEVCEKCHETQGQFTHPIGKGILDPRNGQQLTCVSCHYPHGTNFKFNLKLSGGKDLCIQCHRSY